LPTSNINSFNRTVRRRCWWRWSPLRRAEQRGWPGRSQWQWPDKQWRRRRGWPPCDSGPRRWRHDPGRRRLRQRRGTSRAARGTHRSRNHCHRLRQRSIIQLTTGGILREFSCIVTLVA